MPSSPLTFTTAERDALKRLDIFLLEKLPQYSRARLQTWIKDGHVLVNDAPAKASLTLRGGESIAVSPGDLPPLKAGPEDLPLEILYEDKAVIAINKPAGLVVHAGAGANSGTLVNRLVHHFQTLSQVGGDLRPGIVHRLDKGTSGVLLVARNDAAHQSLAAQFSGRTVEKTYLTLVHGHVKDDSGRLTARIDRDPSRRIKMTTRLGTGRTALTEYRVLNRITTNERSPRKFTYVEVRIGTGRTHQIRVHLSSIGHPVAGDRTYGAPPVVLDANSPERIFLHAHRIVFTSPDTEKRVTVEAPLPEDLERWLKTLKST